MYWLACILLGSAILGGLARLVIYFTGREDLLLKSEGVMGRERHLLLALFYVLSSGLGFFSLSNETVEPLGILIGLPMMIVILEVTFRKGSVDPF